MRKVNEIITDAFKEVVFDSYFDVVEGNKPIKMGDKMCTIPKKMYDHIKENGKCCCFVLSAAMIHIMHNEDLDAKMIMTKEDTGMRASVLYADEAGKLFVANPVQDVEYFTEKNIPSDKREVFYDGASLLTRKGKFNAAKIPVEKFFETYGDITVMPGFYVDEEMTLRDAMAEAKKLDMKG